MLHTVSKMVNFQYCTFNLNSFRWWCDAGNSHMIKVAQKHIWVWKNYLEDRGTLADTGKGG